MTILFLFSSYQMFRFMGQNGCRMAAREISAAETAYIGVASPIRYRTDITRNGNQSTIFTRLGKSYNHGE
jgi:hypothetical protein